MIKKFVKKFLEKWKASNGLLTKKGGYICRAEWHAFVIGISMFGLAYLMPTPLGELVVVAYLMMMRTGFKKITANQPMKGHLGDVMHEMAYAWTSGFITVLYFEVFTGFQLSEIQVNQLVRAMFGV